MLLIGFQLGNTGVMLAGIRDVTPRARLGTTIAIFGASGPVGFAVGPALAGILIDGLGWSLSAVFAFSALLSVGTALLVTFGSQEVRPEVVPSGRVVDLAFAALRGVLTDADPPDLPHLRDLVPGHPDEPAVHPGPRRGDRRHRTGPRLGHRAGGGDGGARRGARLAARRCARRPDRLPAGARRRASVARAPSCSSCRSRDRSALALLAVVLGAATAAVGSMIFGLLATELPAERRSAALNLVYLPLYAAGIIGPAAGAVVASVSGVHGRSCAGRPCSCSER